MTDQTINMCLCNLILNVPASQIPILFHPDLLPRYCACTCCLWVDFSIYKISHTFVFHSDSVECFPLENSFGVCNWSILSILKNDQEQLSYFKFWWKLKQGSVQGTYVFVKMFNGVSLEVDYSLHAFFPFNSKPRRRKTHFVHNINYSNGSLSSFSETKLKK